MHIQVRGLGPALVLIHGWAMHAGLFAPLAEHLAGSFTLHLVDLPGHGRSRGDLGPLEPGACARRIAERTPPALWLGWSLGGLVALEAALSRPAAVRGLIGLCASPRFTAAADWPQGMAAETFAAFARGLAGDPRATIDRFLILETHGSDHAREELRLLRETVYAHGEPTAAALRQGLAALEESDYRAALPALRMPSLWLAGRRDRLTHPAALRAAAAACPEGRYVEIAGAGHAPFLTHAEAVAAAIYEFAWQVAV